MANCVNYNCDELADHLKVDCEEFNLGGVPQVIVLECDHTITDPSNATQVQTNLDNGKAKLIQNVKFGVDAPSPIEIDSPIACQTPSVVNFDRSGTYVDANVTANNNNFYDSLNGRSIGGLILYECDPGRITWIDAAVKFKGGRVIPVDNNDFQRYEGTFHWKKKTEPTIHSAPAGIFD